MYIFKCGNCGANTQFKNICPNCGAHLEDNRAAVSRSKRAENRRAFIYDFNEAISSPIKFISRKIPFIENFIGWDVKCVNIPFWLGVLFIPGGTIALYLLGTLTSCLIYLFSTFIAWLSVICIIKALDILDKIPISRELGWKTYNASESNNSSKAWIIYGILFSIGIPGFIYPLLLTFFNLTSFTLLIICAILFILCILIIIYLYIGVRLAIRTDRLLSQSDFIFRR